MALLIAGVLWVALSVLLALILSRAVQVADARESRGAIALLSGPDVGQAPSKFVGELTGSRRGPSQR